MSAHWSHGIPSARSSRFIMIPPTQATACSTPSPGACGLAEASSGFGSSPSWARSALTCSLIVRARPPLRTRSRRIFTTPTRDTLSSPRVRRCILFLLLFAWSFRPRSRTAAPPRASGTIVPKRTGGDLVPEQRPREYRANPRQLFSANHRGRVAYSMRGSQNCILRTMVGGAINRPRSRRNAGAAYAMLISKTVALTPRPRQSRRILAGGKPDCDYRRSSPAQVSHHRF